MFVINIFYFKKLNLMFSENIFILLKNIKYPVNFFWSDIH